MADLCSLSQNVASQNKIDLDNNEFINSYLIPEVEIQYKINATVKFFENSTPTRIISFLNYLRATIRANYLVSALNTNFLIRDELWEYGYKLFRTEIFIKNSTANTMASELMGCRTGNPTAGIGLVPNSNKEPYSFHWLSYEPSLDATLVNGFFAGCTPLEGLFRSTLDCLHSIGCINLLKHYFPAIVSVCMIQFHLP